MIPNISKFRFSVCVFRHGTTTQTTYKCHIVIYIFIGMCVWIVYVSSFFNEYMVALEHHFVRSAFSGRWKQATILPYMASHTNPCITTPFIPRIYYVSSMVWMFVKLFFSSMIRQLFLELSDSYGWHWYTIWNDCWWSNDRFRMIYFAKWKLQSVQIFQD